VFRGKELLTGGAKPLSFRRLGPRRGKVKALPAIAVSAKLLLMPDKNTVTDTEAALGAIKSVMLLNGGGALAMLAFIAYVAESRPSSIPVLAPTLLPFAFGTFAGGLIYGGRYAAQYYYAQDQMTWGNRITGLCVVLGMASYITFLAGLMQVYFVLSNKL
jgi:hypothetical protein